MAWAFRTYTFSPSTTVRSSEVNQNFTDLVNVIDIAMPSSASGHGIIMFSGAIASIPTGWYLCNGSNGTPDLRDKFIVGAGSTYAVGAEGGEATHALSVAELAVHHHAYSAAGTGPQYSGSGSAAYPVGANTGDTGSGTAHNNLPPYHALAFIMKS